MKLFFSVLALFFSQIVWGQGFMSSRIQPMLSAQDEYAQILNLPKDLASWDCPPDLEHRPLNRFTFLDSLPLNPQFEEELLSLFMNSNCQQYYSPLLQFLAAKPFYDSVLTLQSVDAKYAIIPLTISGLNPTLKYQADKSGEWQLSYVNARKYGLRINQWEDERNSRALSTIAAASYLKFLNKYYLNNELLVISAFFTSVPYVNKKVSQLDTINAVSFFNTLEPELQGYFSYLHAWNNWLEHFAQPSTQDYANIYPTVMAIDVTDTLDFKTLAKFLKISETKLHAYNPVLVGGRVWPQSQTAFVLPNEVGITFEAKYAEFVKYQSEEAQRKKEELADLKKQMESGIPDLTKYKAVTYTVKSGDVLGKIATKNQVKVSHIKQWNNLSSDRINVGQKLVLYVPKNASVSLPEETAENKIETKPAKAQPGKGEPIEYIVKNGESLWLIAKKFPGVSSENIMEWNGCTDKISPGMKLKIYAPSN